MGVLIFNRIVRLSITLVPTDGDGEMGSDIEALGEMKEDIFGLAVISEDVVTIIVLEIDGAGKGDELGVIDEDIVAITLSEIDGEGEGSAFGLFVFASFCKFWSKEVEVGLSADDVFDPSTAISSTSIPEMNAFSALGAMRTTTFVAVSLVFVTLYLISYGLKPPPAFAKTSTSLSTRFPSMNASNIRAPTRNSPA